MNNLIENRETNEQEIFGTWLILFGTLIGLLGIIVLSTSVSNESKSQENVEDIKKENKE